MNDYEVSDYGIFTDGVKTSNKYNENIKNAKDTINNYKSQLTSGDIFLGPICDQASKGCDDVTNKTNQLSNNCNTVESYLIDTANNYKSGDNKAKETIISTDKKGNINYDKPKKSTSDEKKSTKDEK